MGRGEGEAAKGSVLPAAGLQAPGLLLDQRQAAPRRVPGAEGHCPGAQPEAGTGAAWGRSLSMLGACEGLSCLISLDPHTIQTLAAVISPILQMRKQIKSTSHWSLLSIKQHLLEVADSCFGPRCGVGEFVS